MGIRSSLGAVELSAVKVLVLATLLAATYFIVVPALTPQGILQAVNAPIISNPWYPIHVGTSVSPYRGSVTLLSCTTNSAVGDQIVCATVTNYGLPYPSVTQGTDGTVCPPDATCALGSWTLTTNTIVPNLVTVIGVAEATSCPVGSPCGWYLVPATGGDYGLVFASGQTLPSMGSLISVTGTLRTPSQQGAQNGDIIVQSWTYSHE